MPIINVSEMSKETLELLLKEVVLKKNQIYEERERNLKYFEGMLEVNSIYETMLERMISQKEQQDKRKTYEKPEILAEGKSLEPNCRKLD